MEIRKGSIVQGSFGRGMVTDYETEGTLVRLMFAGKGNLPKYKYTDRSEIDRVIRA